MGLLNYLNCKEKRHKKIKRILESKSNNPNEINEKIVTYFNKEFKTTFKFVKIGVYKNDNFGTIDGALYISDNQSAIRINWIDENVVGISYWINYTTKYIDYEFEFNEQTNNPNLKELLPSIVSYLKNNIDTEEDVEVKSGNYEVYSYSSENEIIVDENDSSDIIDSIFGNSNKKTKKENIKSIIKSIAKKLNKSLLIIGAEKDNKTLNDVEQILNSYGLSEGDDYIIRNCQGDNDVLIKLLYDFNGKTIIFNNADNMLLKSDDVSKTTRTLLLPNISKIFTYKPSENDKNKDTEQFTFNGEIILITSITKNRLRIKDKELISKCMSININSNDNDIENIIKNSIKDIHIYNTQKIGSNAKEICDDNVMDEVIEFLTSNDFIYHPRNKTNSFTFEILQNTFLIRKSNNKNWKFIALNLL